MSENKATLEAVMGFEAGYEKGVRDMWDCFRGICPHRKSWCTNSINESAICTFKTCPIAQKLLKGVK